MCDLHHTLRAGIVITSQITKREQFMGRSPIKAGSNIVACWPAAQPGCWSIPEQIQIDRIRHLCQKCPLLEFDCGQTDEGDPWFVVYDREREQVVLHVARIECRYVIVRASRPKPLTAALLSAAVDAALDDLYHAGNHRLTA
jgi:hypothetical protein